MPRSESQKLARRKYDEKAYTQIAIRLPKDLIEAWKSALTEDNDTQAGFIRAAIEGYLEVKKNK